MMRFVCRLLVLCTAACLSAQSARAAQILDFVVFGANNVTVGGGSDVIGIVGAGTHVQMAGGSTVTGEVRSGNTVTLNNNAHVYGTVTNPGTLTLGSGATVTTHIVGAPDLPTLPPPTVFASGGTNHTVGNGGTISLGPGSYGAISLGGAADLNLTGPGDYFLASLNAGNGLDLNINAGGGNVRVYVTGKVQIGGVDVFVTGGDASDIYFETHFSGTGGAFVAGGGTDWVGTVFAPYDDIHIGSGSSVGSVTGWLWSGTHVDLEHGLTVMVPEPASAVLLLVGGALLKRGRARSILA